MLYLHVTVKIVETNFIAMDSDEPRSVVACDKAEPTSSESLPTNTYDVLAQTTASTSNKCHFLRLATGENHSTGCPYFNRLIITPGNSPGNLPLSLTSVSLLRSGPEEQKEQIPRLLGPNAFRSGFL